MEKVTYASLGTLGEDFHRSFDTALRHVQKKLGHSHPLFIAGKKKKGGKGTFKDLCPADRRNVLGTFQSAGRGEVRKALEAAGAAFEDWRELGWPQRVAFLRKAAELMAHRQFDLAALLSLEVGKNRLEAIAEVSESVELILYYCRQIEQNHGYEIPLAGNGRERSQSVLKPYGVWAVVTPFNSPLALPAGMVTGALVAGNTVVFKPSSDAPLAGLAFYEVFHDAGLPVGALSFVTGRGDVIGDELLANPLVDGFAFAGSREVGEDILRRFNQARPRPCIIGMGGKNPAVIMPSAHLEAAAEGVLRAAFGMGGQKCSACSRVYVHKQIANAFVECLIQKTRGRKIGDPAARDTFLGPLINQDALKRYERAVRIAKREGRMVCGGAKLTKGELCAGHYVEPTVVTHLPRKSVLFKEEFFVPVLPVAEFKTLEEAIELANETDYGLTAGIFTASESEQERFFDCVQAGTVYANRAGGATTGAWPGLQSFGGWKASGSTGKNALGPYYVPQFMREQSQTVNR